MEYQNDFINNLINKEIKFSNELSEIYHYPDNITHLLYLIIPAFILKYGINFQQLLEECFLKTPIIIDDKQNKIYQAYYFSKPQYDKDKIKIIKGIVLNNYKNIGLIELLDNLIHEFNHAVNSIKNEVQITDNVVIRTGIVSNYFERKTLKYLKQSEEIVLEEIINTKQTEIIMDIIKNFSNYKIEDTTVVSTLYSIYHLIDSNYHSNSYLLESIVCHKLLENKTFLSTLENLRFHGNIENIHNFFDLVMNKEGSLLELCNLLNDSLNYQKELMNIKWFKKIYINKIKKVDTKALDMVEKFNKNTIYK